MARDHSATKATLNTAPTPTEITTLQTQFKLLHLLHARSRNQHRRSHWYRSFGTLRRELRRLLSDLDAQTLPKLSRREMKRRGLKLPGRAHAKATESASSRVQEFGGGEERAARVRARIEWWIENGKVRRWHDAFSSLLAETQFAGVAGMLLGVLARVCAVLRIPERLTARKDLEKDDRPVEERQGGEDLGEVVQRR